ncbi:bZIP transcription factor 44 [Cucumis sativus]|uniref:BZIP domain-containing protein n=1 Tax=Cucumis sativus TaxID=3659 RepID=A0A0A0KMA4_CUCSA|nr:bZIP transcription factor 44 [Cucumis sativus]KGN48871.1 hypothetical protein Csa_002932 [Cucumis sativus]
MASSSGVSSGSTNGGIRPSRSEDDLEEERKRRRMQSNRESARRSRLRKQKHLDDLTNQVSRLRNHNNEMTTNMTVTMSLCISLEGENSILEAQILELTNRLKSLNNIIKLIESMEVLEKTFSCEIDDLNNDFEEEDYCNPWRYPFAN